MKFRKILAAVTVIALVCGIIPQTSSANTSASEAFETIQFGGHSWLVLAREGDRTFVVSERILFNQRFTSGFGGPGSNNMWAYSEIRSYLNNEFLSTFSAEERARIVRTQVVNNNTVGFFDFPYDVDAGPDTIDRIFLLSIDEVERYLVCGIAEEHPIWSCCVPLRIAHNTEGVARNWWLRSPANRTSLVAAVSNSGGIEITTWVGGINWGLEFGIRPAMWISDTAVIPEIERINTNLGNVTATADVARVTVAGGGSVDVTDVEDLELTVDKIAVSGDVNSVFSAVLAYMLE
jgi:hypothetical protein